MLLNFTTDVRKQCASLKTTYFTTLLLLQQFSSSAQTSEEGTLLKQFNNLIQCGILHHDPHQKIVLNRLSQLQTILKSCKTRTNGVILSKPIPPDSLKSYEFDHRDQSENAKKWRLKKDNDLIQYEKQLNQYNFDLNKQILETTPRGMYIWGDVGTGKSMLMDLFVETCPLPTYVNKLNKEYSLNSKRRVHFHQFMLEIHKRLHLKRQEQLVDRNNPSTNEKLNPLQAVANDLANETLLFAFDEFQMTDVCDALILGQVLEEMWNRGVITIMTSNRPPQDLYQQGFNNAFFQKFMIFLEDRCYIQHLKSTQDYRLLLASNNTQLGSYFLLPPPFSSSSSSSSSSLVLPIKEVEPVTVNMESLLRYLLWLDKDESLSEYQIVVMMNRTLQIKKGRPFKMNSSPSSNVICSENSTNVTPDRSGVCLFSFTELCCSDIGAADYKSLCDNFHTLLIEHVPKMTQKDHNKARRFVTLIDELYEHQIRVIISAETSPFELFQINQDSSEVEQEENEELKNTMHVEDFTAVIGSEDVTKSEIAAVKDLAFAFKRASSRLTEMSGKTYHVSHAAKWPEARPLPSFAP